MDRKKTSTRKELAQKHSFINELIFSAKTKYLILRRKISNRNIKKFSNYKDRAFSEVWAQSKSELWNKNDNIENWIMTAGKIQNLRIAATSLNGIIIPAGEIFSLWKHIGKPSKARGFVIGREIREGCIVPSVAGGICQLSNALYDAASKAGLCINERHRHTQIVKGSLAEQGRDATVKWNYIDLRFSCPNDFQISIDMDENYLTVEIKGKEQKNAQQFTYLHTNAPSPLNDCLSCRNTDCYICATNDKLFNEGSTTYILDEKWDEYEDYINSKIYKQDFVLQPFSPFWSRLLKRDNYKWNIKSNRQLYYSKEAIFRLINFHQNKPKNLFSWQLEVDEKLALNIISKIPIESTHLVITQNLLPFLQKYHALAGRTYEVLMLRSSVDSIQSELDSVLLKYPNSSTLSDFRASSEFIEIENRALNNAEKIITPHLKISQSYTNSILLNWAIPKPPVPNTIPRTKILFAGSPLGRKGAYEFRQLVKDLNLSVIIASKTIEYPNFFEGLDVTFSPTISLDEIGLIIYPAYIEHHPKIILKAISYGIPVAISEACGITASDNVSTFPSGDYNAMKSIVKKLLNKTRIV